MELGESRLDGALVLAPVGRIDSDTASTLEARLLLAAEHGDAQVVVDFAQVQYISSAGLRALLAGAKQVQNSGGAVALCGINMNVREVFEVSGFVSVFTVRDDRAEAVNALR